MEVMTSSIKKDCMPCTLTGTRNEDVGSAQRYLCESGSENGKVETKGSYLYVILVAVAIILKLGVT